VRRRSRTEQRREKLRVAAALFAAGKKQVEVARELDKNVRTIRRWQRLTGFEAELAKAKLRQERAAEREQRQAERRRERNARRQLARSDPHRYAQLYGVASSRRSPRPREQPLPLPPARGRVLRVIPW
jgi:transposase